MGSVLMVEKSESGGSKVKLRKIEENFRKITEIYNSRENGANHDQIISPHNFEKLKGFFDKRRELTSSQLTGFSDKLGDITPLLVELKKLKEDASFITYTGPIWKRFETAIGYYRKLLSYYASISNIDGLIDYRDMKSFSGHLSSLLRSYKMDGGLSEENFESLTQLNKELLKKINDVDKKIIHFNRVETVVIATSAGVVATALKRVYQAFFKRVVSSESFNPDSISKFLNWMQERRNDNFCKIFGNRDGNKLIYSMNNGESITPRLFDKFFSRREVLASIFDYITSNGVEQEEAKKLLMSFYTGYTAGVYVKIAKTSNSVLKTFILNVKQELERSFKVNSPKREIARFLKDFRGKVLSGKTSLNVFLTGYFGENNESVGRILNFDGRNSKIFKDLAGRPLIKYKLSSLLGKKESGEFMTLLRDNPSSPILPLLDEFIKDKSISPDKKIYKSLKDTFAPFKHDGKRILEVLLGINNGSIDMDESYRFIYRKLRPKGFFVKGWLLKTIFFPPRLLKFVPRTHTAIRVGDIKSLPRFISVLEDGTLETNVKFIWNEGVKKPMQRFAELGPKEYKAMVGVLRKLLKENESLKDVLKDVLKKSIKLVKEHPKLIGFIAAGLGLTLAYEYAVPSSSDFEIDTPTEDEIKSARKKGRAVTKKIGAAFDKLERALAWDTRGDNKQNSKAKLLIPVRTQSKKSEEPSKKQTKSKINEVNKEAATNMLDAFVLFIGSFSPRDKDLSKFVDVVNGNLTNESYGTALNNINRFVRTEFEDKLSTVPLSNFPSFKRGNPKMAWFQRLEMLINKKKYTQVSKMIRDLCNKNKTK